MGGGQFTNLYFYDPSASGSDKWDILYAVHPTFASSCWGKEREGHSREDRGETGQREDRKKDQIQDLWTLRNELRIVL